MVQNTKFATAIDDGLLAADAVAGNGTLEEVIALVRPVVACVREHVENGRTYLHELVFGDPAEPNRREGLTLAGRLEVSIAFVLARRRSIDPADAATLARLVTAIIQVATTATIYVQSSDEDVLANIRMQVQAMLAPRKRVQPLTPQRRIP